MKFISTVGKGGKGNSIGGSGESPITNTPTLHKDPGVYELKMTSYTLNAVVSKNQ